MDIEKLFNDFESENIQINEIYKCCDNPNIIFDQYFMVCTRCGIITNDRFYVNETGQDYILDYRKKTYSSNIHFMDTIKKMFHFKSSEKIFIDNELIIEIKSCKNFCNIENILKKHKLNHLYIYANYIAFVYLNISLPIFTIENYIKFRNRYSEYQYNYSKCNCLFNRKNHIKLSYIIERFCHELNLQYLIPFVTRKVKNKNKRKFFNNIYNMVNGNNNK